MPNPARRSLRALAAAGVALAAMPAPAALAIPPGGAAPSHNGAAVELAASAVAPGGALGATGRRFPAGKSATVKLDDETILAVFPIDARGHFGGRVAIPKAITRLVKPGRHWLRFLAPASSKNHQSNTSIKTPFTLEKR